MSLMAEARLAPSPRRFRSPSIKGTPTFHAVVTRFPANDNRAPLARRLRPLGLVAAAAIAVFAAVHFLPNF